MNRTTLILLIVILLELPFFGRMIFNKVTMHRPPIPNLSPLDRLTADRLVELANNCRTFDDWRHLADNYLALGYFVEAEACYQQAAEIEPENSEIAFDLGFCLSRGGKIIDANRQFERAIELGHPTPLAATYFIGRNHLRSEDPDAAKAAFRRAAKLPICKYELAKILFREGQLDESLELLIEALDEAPDSMRCQPLMSRIFAAKGNARKEVSFSVEGSEQTDRMWTPFEDARGKIKETFGKTGYESRLNEAFGMASNHQMEEAREVLYDLQDMQWTLDTNKTLIDVERSLANRKEVVALMEERIRRRGTLSELYAVLAEFLELNGAEEQAKYYYLLGAQVSNDDSCVRCLDAIAKYYEKAGDQANSVKYQVLAIHEIAKQYLRDGEFKRALAISQEGSELDPSDAKCYYHIGKAQRLLFEFEEAKKAYEKCLELDPTFGRAIRELRMIIDAVPGNSDDQSR